MEMRENHDRLLGEYANRSVKILAYAIDISICACLCKLIKVIYKWIYTKYMQNTYIFIYLMETVSKGFAQFFSYLENL